MVLLLYRKIQFSYWLLAECMYYAKLRIMVAYPHLKTTDVFVQVWSPCCRSPVAPWAEGAKEGVLRESASCPLFGAQYFKGYASAMFKVFPK